jgi:hypothetical protein
MKKIFLRSIAAIVGIVIGGGAGGYLTFHKYARDYPVVRALAWTGIFDAVSVNQYDVNGSDAKQDLLSVLEIFTQGVKSSAIDPAMKNAFRMKRGLTEARLSVLESEAGNVDGARSYLSKAQEDLTAVGWIDHSEAHILQAVKRQPVSPCGSTPQIVAKTTAPATSKPCG